MQQVSKYFAITIGNKNGIQEQVKRRSIYFYKFLVFCTRKNFNMNGSRGISTKFNVKCRVLCK